MLNWDNGLAILVIVIIFSWLLNRLIFDFLEKLNFKFDKSIKRKTIRLMTNSAMGHVFFQGDIQGFFQFKMKRIVLIDLGRLGIPQLKIIGVMKIRSKE